MAHESRDQLIHWLNDALGMEETMIQTLGNHVKDAGKYPQIERVLQQHLEVTKQQADLVRTCIKNLGASPSGMKQTVGKVQGMIQGISTGPAGDEVVKNCLADYAAEHFEIACYTSLIAACNELGETQTASICDQIRTQEEQMAERLMQAIPTVTSDYLVTKGHQRAA